MWSIKQKSNKYNRNKCMNTDSRIVVPRGEVWWEEGKMGKGDQIYGDRRKLDFSW